MIIEVVARLVLRRAADAAWRGAVSRLVAHRLAVEAFGGLDARTARGGREGACVCREKWR